MAKEKFKFHVFLHRDGGDLEQVSLVDWSGGKATRNDIERLARSYLQSQLGDPNIDVYVDEVVITKEGSPTIFRTNVDPDAGDISVSSFNLDGKLDTVYTIFHHDYQDYLFYASMRSPQDVVNDLNRMVSENYEPGIEVHIDYMFTVTPMGDLKMMDAPAPDEDIQDTSINGMR